MSHATLRRIRRRTPGTVTNVPTLSSTVQNMMKAGIPIKTIGKRRLGARILHSVASLKGTGVMMLFRHPTKAATSGRMCVVSA